jgi:heme/copper-type cytochrome/quinol oxidase subunit 2
MEHKTKQMIEKGILLVPMFLAVMWMSSVIFNVGAPTPDMQLAPSRIDGLVNVLFIFILIYSVVIVFLFIRMDRLSKEVEKEQNHKVINHKKHHAKRKTKTKKSKK